MHKYKKATSMVLSMTIMIIGLYMLVENSWPTPPAISGLGFLLTGLALWLPTCPIMAKICGE